MDDSEVHHSPHIPHRTQLLQQPRFGVEISELSVHSIHREREKPDNFADREDLVHAGPWNVNGALLLLHHWEPDVPLHRLSFRTANMWIQIRGMPLEYMTPALAVRMGSLIGTVTTVDCAMAT
ncbi:hypothetical protein Vadar_024853 [Vaccinium darrowii]|uniref:Uncharacterized protein n=1 Tax=Vaccinium darrowii TaxID=229202 RepID=A0ACB7YPL8_9ERIC|nr:hypothetical protein Vadar_024853 [Vaccinium darrowii]